jgi:hypothetical protein
MSKNKRKKSSGELSSEISKFGFSPGRPENVGLFTVAVFSFHHKSESVACLVALRFLFCPVSGSEIVLPSSLLLLTASSII